jgi:hypothetical protein
MLWPGAAEKTGHASIDQQQRQGLCIRLRSGVDRLTGDFSNRFGGFRNHPLDLTCANFILRDTARFAGTGLYDRGRATLELAGPTGGHEDIAIVAVEAFDQLHTVLP